MINFSIEKIFLNDITVLKLSGYLDAHTSPELEKELDNLLSNNQHKIVVNLENLSYISSAGLGVFLSFIENVRQMGGDIKFSSHSDKIYEIFDLIGFPKIFEFYKNDNEAIEKFKTL